ncbi:hypothetical protein D3C77_429060 [compost metagenome]
MLEHAPGKEIADHLLLVEGRIAQHDVQGLRGLGCQSIVSANADLTITQRRLPVLQGRLGSHIGLINQGVMGLGIAQSTNDGQYAVAATEIGYSR